MVRPLGYILSQICEKEQEKAAQVSVLFENTLQLTRVGLIKLFPENCKKDSYTLFAIGCTQ